MHHLESRSSFADNGFRRLANFSTLSAIRTAAESGEAKAQRKLGDFYNWEYKFLQRAVLADDQIQLVGLIRVAKQEPKFDFRGRVGESSNPLFRSFGNQSKVETERYDQPVLVRLNTRDEVELRGGFPKMAEELYSCHAVIVDDLEAESIAQKTGGEVIAAGQLAKFVVSLPNRKVPITEDWNRPLWHQSGVFLFALACFTAEWGLRRWKGLV